MFDNMAPNKIENLLRKMKEMGYYDNLLFEASGGINIGTVVEYAKTGVDVVSTSEITERAKTLNLKQMIKYYSPLLKLL